jgi:hypothetical protein
MRAGCKKEKLMNFKTAKTSEKLRFLAKTLSRPEVAGEFVQDNPYRCVVAVGVLLKGNGYLRPTTFKPPFKPTCQMFAKKFGITENEALYLYIADYGSLKIRMTFMLGSNVTPEIAAKALNRLAEKYERRGN